MYVRLKHTLSAMALAALRSPARNLRTGPVPWLRAFCQLIDGDEQGRRYEATRAVVARQARASPGRRRNTAAIPRQARELLEPTDGALSLAPAYRPHTAYLARQVHRLDRALRNLARHPAPPGRRGIVRKGAALFNAGLFFECHEYLEAPWRRASGDDRFLYHGIILVAAAFYHHEKGNLHGARIKLTEGMKDLQRAPAWSGLKVREWLQTLAPWLSRLEAGYIPGVLRDAEIPRMAFSSGRRVRAQRKRAT
jgi:hypothetical protein